MNLYRIHYAWKSGGASSSEVDYYESEDRLKSDLIDHHLDMVESRNNWLNYVLAQSWRRHRGTYDNKRRTTSILRVEKVVNDEWTPVEYEFVQPDVVLK